jgi:hypothetical protein
VTSRTAFRRIAIGLTLLTALYVTPLLVGTLTAGERLMTCPGPVPPESNVIVQLAFVPNSTEIQSLQRFGRYGGSGGNLANVILLRVSAENLRALSRMYWIDRVVPRDACKPE